MILDVSDEDNSQQCHQEKELYAFLRVDITNTANMSDQPSGEAAYIAQTVVELKAELKKRGIPTTKLTRKQQIIDRLLQFDAESATEPAQERAPPATNDAPEVTAKSAPPPQLDGFSDAPPREAQAEGAVSGDTNEDVKVFVAPTVEVANEPAPAIPSPTRVTPDAEESRKRKRRSLTPAVKEQDVQKKLRNDQSPIKSPAQSKASIVADAPIAIGKPDTTINLGAGITETETVGEDGETAAPVATTKVPESGHSAEEVAKEAPQPDDTVQPMQVAKPPEDEEVVASGVDILPETAIEDATQESHTLATTHTTSQEVDLQRSQPPEPDPTDSLQREEDERTVHPAVHPATTALYIRGLQRPLHSDTFQEYLKSLAAKPSTTDATNLVEFHLDAIRTHAFASFTSLAAAARVRSALHDRVWPQERDRKPLWVDFVPEDQMHAWIEREKDDVHVNGARNAKRWEVVYEEKPEGNTVATFREVGATPSGPSHSHMNAPTAPRSMLPKPEVHREAPAAAQNRKPESAQFLALDTLFRSTTAKPKVYFLPVQREVADRRLDELGAKMGRGRSGWADGANGANGGDGRRYTWEEGVFVDAGPEFGLRQDRDVRGPPRGGGGGGYRGDRGYGGGGRGRGDAYRPGGGDYRPRDRRDRYD